MSRCLVSVRCVGQCASGLRFGLLMSLLVLSLQASAVEYEVDGEIVSVKRGT